MATKECAGCGRSVRIAGGAGTLWSFEDGGPEGMTLELTDGTEAFLCFACIEALPENPATADIAELPERDDDTAVDDGGSDAILVGLIVGGIVAALATLITGELGLWGSIGFAAGFGTVVAIGRIGEYRTG